MNYNVDFFIEKFEAIPEEKWCEYIQQNDVGQRCAYGHCMPLYELKNGLMLRGYGAYTEQGKSLKSIFHNAGMGHEIAYINNGEIDRYQQPTPKQRILAALYDIKSNQAINEVKEIIAEKRTVIERLTENA